MNKNFILKTETLSKTYLSGVTKLHVLNNVDFSISQGEIACIQGASGSGKSTLLHILGGLDSDYTGNIFVQNKNLAQIGETQRADLRNKHIGFVFQFFNLLPEFTALENIALPLMIAGVSKKNSFTKAEILLNKVSLLPRASHKPNQLSGGEQQRVAIARALSNNPDLILCDEPTGNLDEETSGQIQDVLIDLNINEHKTIIIVTHDETLAKKIKKRYYLSHGNLILQ